MTSQNRLQIRPLGTHTDTHRVLENPNIYLLGVEFDWIVRWLSKCADVSPLPPLPPFLQASVNISDTGEMGASTPAPATKPFISSQQDLGEMLYGREQWDVIYTVTCSTSKIYASTFRPCQRLRSSKVFVFPNFVWSTGLPSPCPLHPLRLIIKEQLSF